MQIRSPPPLPRPTPHVGANPRPTASNLHAIYGGLGQQGYWNQSSFWSGRWESNPRPKLGKLLYCHCTTPAHSQSFDYTRLSDPRTSAPIFLIFQNRPKALIFSENFPLPAIRINFVLLL